MTAIWQNDGTGWRLLAPTGFPDEQTLHDLVEETPRILPLAGDPRLVVLGKEVGLGNGYADLVAIEPSGRLVVVEIKLSKNAEARRAVVAQILTYAAHLRGLSPEMVERDVLGHHLRNRGYESIQEAIASNDQEGSFDPAVFSEGLAECLTIGHFRLVLVLDEAPQELVTLVGYPESVTEGLSIDLIAVSAYEVGGSRVLVPQRVDAERPTPEPLPPKPSPSGPEGRYVEGAEDFAATIDSAKEEQRMLLRRLYEWAVSLDREGFVRLGTYHAKGGKITTLLPSLRADNAGLVTIYNDRGTARLQFWRSVFERRAPESLPRVEHVAPVQVGQGNTTYEVSDELLEVLTDSYREAALGKIGG
jgi:hypothetical protein